MAPCSETTLVHYRGGFVADWQVVERLMDLENRGARFELMDGGGFRVLPPSVLTAGDTALLRARRDDARRVLEYQADDSHLFTDGATR